MKRRDFLQGLLALGAFSALPAPLRAASPRRLVMIHLFGGNDGLNTVVPYTDLAYRKARPTLAQSDVLPLRSGLGRAAVLAALELLVEQGSKAGFALSYEAENVTAAGLYTSLGFVPTGERVDDEVVARRPPSGRGA